QRWDMFSSPRKFDQYVRLTYYVTTSGDRNPTVVREFIYPTLADDQIRVTYTFRDKAVSTALERYLTAKSRGLNEQQALPNLAPVTRYFSARYMSARPSSSVTRTEFWYGVAPIPEPGLMFPANVWKTRLDLVSDYHTGPWTTLYGGPEPLVSTFESEAD